MESLDDLLGKDDQLSRIVEYELYRLDNAGKSDRIVIFVSEALNGDRKGKFYARPRSWARESKHDYIGRGNSVEDALRDCLTKIKGLSFDDVLQ